MLLKPDGLSSPHILRDIERSFADADITVTDAWDVELTLPDLAWLWPQHVNERCPITTRLLEHYLAYRTCRVWTVVGGEVVARSNAVKRQVRGRHAYGPFANCLHTPADEHESSQQLRFLRAPADRRRAVPAPSAPRRAGAYGRVARLGPWHLRDVADRVAARAVSERWDRLAYRTVGTGPFALLLCDDNHNSIDYAASSLCAVFDTLTVEEALAAVLRAALTPAPVAYGSLDKVAEWAARLRAAGQVVECRAAQEAVP